MVEQQLRRYFIGIISFAFIVTWVALGAITAFLAALTSVAAMVIVPAFLEARRRHHRSARPTPERRPAPRRVTTRPLAEEDRDELPLVPDEPSLIIGVSS
jgi:hypothetical protein